jgi:hypothetical protein
MKIGIVLLAAASTFGTLAAQTPNAAGESPAVRRALESIRAGNAWTLEQQVSICEIPAPPFAEARRTPSLAHASRRSGW